MSGELCLAMSKLTYLTNMEIITREIIRQKGDKQLIYKFSTFDCIFRTALLEQTNETGKIFRHLHKMFTTYMPDAPKSPSQAKGLHCEIKELQNHELSQLAHASAYYGLGNKQHETVQRYFLENDAATLAAEMPVYDHEEAGCVDIVRQVGGRIELLDFKPDAHKEKNVSGQLYRYARLLSKQADIPMSQIDLFYFDGEKTYQVII